MLKFFTAVTLSLFLSNLVPQSAFATGKTAYVMTCKPGNLGEIVIEPMVYDNAGGNKFDNVPQYNDRNFFYLKQKTKEKLSKSLVEGNVTKKEFRWRGQTLIGYLEEYASDTLPKKKRSLTDTVPLNAKRYRGPGSEVRMNIEGNAISCEFTTPKNIYTEISVNFYRTGNVQNICGSADDVKSLQVKWFTGKDQEAVKTADVLMSCGHRGGSAYDVSMAKITTIGGVTVDLNRTKVLLQSDRSLYSTAREKQLQAERP